MRDENAVLTISTLVDGHYGISDVCLGVPTVVGKEGVRQVLDIPLSDKELSALRQSASTLRYEIDQCMNSYV